MKEQVKEWIADKNLTIDSFDSIMIGVIYNSRHNTLDDPVVRRWIGMHPSEFREMLPPNLNENQQIVLEWLKAKFTSTGKSNPIGVVYLVHFANQKATPEHTEMWMAYRELTKHQEAQVLQAFSQWALEQEG